MHTVNIIVTAVQDTIDRSGLGSDSADADMQPTREHQSVLLRLVPLRRIEDELKSHLGAGTTEVDISPRSPDLRENTKDLELNRALVQEFTFRSSSGWKSILAQVKKSQSGKDPLFHQTLCQAVASCRQDIQWLWNDSVTQSILQRRHLKLDDAPGLYVKTDA